MHLGRTTHSSPSGSSRGVFASCRDGIAGVFTALLHFFNVYREKQVNRSAEIRLPPAAGCHDRVVTHLWYPLPASMFCGQVFEQVSCGLGPE